MIYNVVLAIVMVCKKKIWKKLKSPNHFITKQMSEKSCDTLFSAKTKDDKDAWIFTLCEHQSSPNATSNKIRS